MFADWVGILGSGAIAGAYLAATRKWLAADEPVFNILNLIGAGLILFSLYHRPNVGAIIIEILWILIAIWALVSWIFKRGRERNP